MALNIFVHNRAQAGLKKMTTLMYTLGNFLTKLTNYYFLFALYPGLQKILSKIKFE